MLRFGITIGFVFALLFSNHRALSQDYIQDEIKVIHQVLITAYTASVKECGKADGITSSGLRVRKGCVSCDFLPKGTKIRIPALFGDRIFIVMDMFNRKKHGETRVIRYDIPHKIDIYVKHYARAIKIGKTRQSIEIVSEV